jgi:hypothetical protein
MGLVYIAGFRNGCIEEYIAKIVGLYADGVSEEPET